MVQLRALTFDSRLVKIIKKALNPSQKRPLIMHLGNELGAQAYLSTCEVSA